MLHMTNINVLQKISLMCAGFMRRKTVVVLAFLATVSTCAFQDSVLLIRTPRYFELIFQVDGVVGINRFPLLGDPGDLEFICVK